MSNAANAGTAGNLAASQNNYLNPNMSFPGMNYNGPGFAAGAPGGDQGGVDFGSAHPPGWQGSGVNPDLFNNTATGSTKLRMRRSSVKAPSTNSQNQLVKELDTTRGRAGRAVRLLKRQRR